MSTGGKLPVEAICTWAVLVPEEPGANWTEIVQEVASNRAVPIAQVPPTTENDAASPPIALSRVSVAPPGPWLSTVTVCAADTEPAETEPKSRVVTAGENTSTGTAAALPLPRSTEACGEPAALLTTVSAPV